MKKIYTAILPAFLKKALPIQLSQKYRDMPPQAQVDRELFILLITKKENLEKTLPLASYPTRFRNWNAKLSIDPHFCAMRVLRNISFSFQAWCKRDPV